jgi:hypothetical protein
MTRCLVANPVTNFEANGKHNGVLGDAKDDDVPTCSISNVGAHFKCREALPFPILLIP